MWVRFSNAGWGALSAAAACALLEVLWIQRASAAALNWARAWVVAFGLLVPSALLAMLMGAVLAGLLGASGSRQAAREELPRAGEWGLLTGLAAALWLALTAQLALTLFSLELDVATFAAALALASALLGRLLLGAALALSRAGASRARASQLGARTRAALALAALLAPMAWGVATGTTNGEGGLFGIFGVLRRQELDLRPVGVVAAMVLAAAAAARLRRPHLFSAGSATLVALAAFSATALRLLDDPPLALALERGGAASRMSASLLRRVSDRDGDGASPYFGENDCDDADDTVYPGAVDVPGDGRDEDCSGADATASVPPPATAPEPAAPEPAPRQRLPKDLNVILITVDTLRYDLGFAGYERPISAHLDRLAARSVVFEHAYALASYTGKSIGPLLIGKYPSETDRGFLHFNRFGTSETFLQERLQSTGVRTVSVQGHWYFTPEYGLGRGFDVLDLGSAPRKRQLEGDKTVNSDLLSDAAIARLKDPANTSGRFFLWVHYLDPHAEYMRHAGFDFGNRGRDLYDSEVAFTDQQIGRLIDFVEASSFGARTAIVVTSDHGEAFGEHGMWRHGFELWEALVRVPLVIHVPGVAPRRLGVRRSAIDLAPTLLELFGVPLPEGDARLSGRSLLEDVLMPEGQEPAARPVFIDMSAGPYNEERQALIQDDVKLIMSSGRVIGLYDLARDPEEKQDLSKDRALVRQQREQFEAFRRGLRLVHVKPR